MQSDPKLQLTNFIAPQSRRCAMNTSNLAVAQIMARTALTIALLALILAGAALLRVL